MKDYNEMAQAVFKRRDEYLVEQKRKKAMFYKSCIPVCSLLLVTLTGLLLWQAKMPEIPVKEPTPATAQDTNTSPTSADNNDNHNVNTDNIEGSVHTDDTPADPVVTDKTGSPENTQNIINSPTQEEHPNQNEDSNDNKAPTQGAVQPTLSDTVTSSNTKPTKPNTEDAGNDMPNYSPSEDLTEDPPLQTESPPPSMSDDAPVSKPPFPNDMPLQTQPAPDSGSDPLTPPTNAPSIDDTSNGVLKIVSEAGTFEAQVGQKITYTVELQAAERFESIQVDIRYDEAYLSPVIPSDKEESVVPNMSGAMVGSGYGNLRMNATSITKYNFKNKKVLLTVDFIVRKAGEVNLTFTVEEMVIQSPNMYTEELKYYFIEGQQVTSQGITFYHKITV